MGLTFHSYEPGLNGEGRELVVRKDVVQNGAWNSSRVDNAYATSIIDSWFNGTYKGYFSTSVRDLMGSTTFYYTPGNDDDSVIPLARASFALSVTELGLSNSDANVEGSALPIASVLRNLGAYQWTRTPFKDTANVFFLNFTNSIDGGYTTLSNGYRPCFTLPSTATVTEELELVEG